MKTNIRTLLIISLSIYTEQRFGEELYGKSKHILCISNFYPEQRTVYDIMWKNMVLPDSP